MLIINDLSVAYGKNTVLQQLNLQLPKAQIHGIVGLNGSGKTTLLHTIFGLLQAKTGDILFDNQAISKKNIAYLETKPFFYSRITGKEYLQLFQINHPQFDLQQWNRLFELPLTQLIDTYSTGMKKKLALLGVLALNKPILILDEPFNGLDLESNEKVKEILKILRAKGTTILVTSHILETLTTLCDTISYLVDGCIQFTYQQKEFPQLEQLLRGQLQAQYQEMIQDLLKDEEEV